MEKELSRALEVPRVPLRKATSTSSLNRNALRSIENNSLPGKIFKKNNVKVHLVQPSKENMKLLHDLAPKLSTRVNILTDKSRLTRMIKQTISIKRGGFQNKDNNKSENVDRVPSIVKIPKDVLDVDVGDSDPMQFNEYAKDVFRHLREVETNYIIQKNFLSRQSETNGEMRADLVDWIHRNASRFELYEETFYLAVAIVDLYLQRVDIPAGCLPLVGITALMLACKYEEVKTPSLNELVRMGQFRYSRSDLLGMEWTMLKSLDFRVGRPVPIQFLRRYSQANRCGRLSHNLSKFFLELSLLSDNLSRLAPSLLATAASCLSLWVLADLRWTAEMEFYSGYTATEVAPVTRELARFVETHETLKNQAVRRKFSGEKYLQVARLPQLSAIIKCFP